MEFRCDWKQLVDQAREEVIWTVPDNWGECRIYAFGAPGTTFDLLELPDARPEA